MPGYLSASAIESCIQYIASTFPSIAQVIMLPETSVEGRTCRALKIAKGGGSRRAVLFVGGVHARELINPDLLVNWTFQLCQAYTNNTGITFGPKSYGAGIVKLLVEGLDILVFPLVNPDGRVYVQTVDAWWRKNRNPNPGQPCRGVDINRNYDFLWSSGIGTSSNTCADVFKGGSAFSEPETRNVRNLLDNHPNIECMVDVHSYSQLVLYPWGDDTNQSTDPAMNFQNPAFNGLRGNPGDTIYKEYIPAADWDRFHSVGERVRDAIAAVRGRVYTVEQGVLLYPTSGTSKDYAYSRHFVDAGKRKVLSYVLETATEFQPSYAEAQNVMTEVGAGLVEFCLACLCAVESMSAGTSLSARVDRLRRFRDQVILISPVGRHYVQLLEANTLELLVRSLGDSVFRKRAVDLLEKIADVIVPRRGGSRPIPGRLIEAAGELLKMASEKASPTLKRTLKAIEADLPMFANRTVAQALKEIHEKNSPLEAYKR